MEKALEHIQREDEDYVYINFEGIKKSINVKEFKKNQRVHDLSHKTEKKGELIDFIKIGTKIYYLYTTNSKNLYITDTFNRYANTRQKLVCRINNNYVCFYGIFTNPRQLKNFDNIVLNKEIVGKVKRPFGNIKKLKNFVIIKIKIEDIISCGRIHNNIRIGRSKELSVPILMNLKHDGMNYWARKKVGDNLIVVRSIISGSKIKISNIKFSPEYKKINLLKNFIAYNLSKIINNKKINLLFEKETNRASESGYYSFEKIMEYDKKYNLDSKNYFVIDKNSPDYADIKLKYKNNIIEKYSFKHYLYIYLSKYFISSELSNHVINPRIYLWNLNKCISTKPLVFLQHGIMFSKPVDNPAASNFRKDFEHTYYYKNIISSDLEATQFYKCGFEDEDLIKCGLPKFDIAKMDDDADKIMVMLTYRFWEETFVNDEEKIKETTYYQAYMKIFKAFEENNLLNKLMVSCHPKFTEFLNNLNPKYANCVENDIGKALAKSKIFITDYSSASYDAHYRGSYIIYYWEEKEYLIEKYGGAIPPINEDNCDGVPVFSIDELINEVKKAINNNYIMDDLYQERYRKINEFHDGKNGDRLVKELIKLDII